MDATSTANKKLKTIQDEDAAETVTSDHSDNDDGSEMYESDDNPLHDFEEDDDEFEAPDFVAYDDDAAALQAKFDAEDLPAGAEVSVPWLDEHKPDPTRPPVPCSSSKVPMQFQDDDSDEAIMKYKSFKSFDTVEDFSDHHYLSKSVTKSKQTSQEWTRAIQQDWRLLEKDLPNTIFVRAYEGRMDLLRAVIVGATETPYHDGLFFFDIHYPSEYPNGPPLVNYHSHNQRLNPNLYNCGKVCLSLLNTWGGSKVERWTPGKSNMLQVLLSIQALVLNEKPYFNEPGWAPSAGTPQGEQSAREYNETTFILSCKAMLYTLKNPPKYFEDYVLGHFRVRAYTILCACKAYIEGALVGSAVKDVEDDDDNESQNSSSKKEVQHVNEVKKYGYLYYRSNPFPSGHFKSEVGVMAGNLVPIFNSMGAKNCEQFICLGDAYRLAEANYSNIFKKDFYKPAEEQVVAAESQAQI